MKRRVVLVVLAVILPSLVLFAISDTSASVAHTSIPYTDTSNVPVGELDKNLESVRLYFPW